MKTRWKCPKLVIKREWSTMEHYLCSASHDVKEMSSSRGLKQLLDINHESLSGQLFIDAKASPKMLRSLLLGFSSSKVKSKLTSENFSKEEALSETVKALVGKSKTKSDDKSFFLNPSINKRNTNNAKNRFGKAWSENNQSLESFYDFLWSDKNKWLSRKTLQRRKKRKQYRGKKTINHKLNVTHFPIFSHFMNHL